MPTPFRSLAELCEKLESTKKRNEMVGWVAEFIQHLSQDEVQPATSMLMGRAFPVWDQRTLEVSWATISTIIRRITNADDEKFAQAFGKTGDAGDATKLVFERGTRRKQATLFQKQLTILEVYHTFEAIAGTAGTGSREKKERLLETLLGSATPVEAKCIVKVLISGMRTGFHEGLMELAVARAFDVPVDSVQTASMLTGDIGEVAALLKSRGRDGLAALGFKVFRPIKLMLAQMADTVKEALEGHGGETALEYKLDGARIQIHKSGEVVKIFSRRLTDVTESLPEIVNLVSDEVKADETILEGEVIAVGENGNPMPFQHLMRRFRRIRGIELTAEEVPIRLYLFDALYIDGKSLIKEAYTQRREALAKTAGSIPLTKQIIAHDVETAEAFLQEALKAGHEGVMAKKPDSLYTPGVRGKRWFKIKSILEPLDLVIVAAEYGYGRRHGWLSDYHLAALDTESRRFLTVGKTFKGLTDAEITVMTQRLKQLALNEEGYIVKVTPKIVVEVAYNEIQRSPKYECGMALRFARITRIRDDKTPEEADTIQRVREIYERQFGKKAKYQSE
jgi:DNA ligase-1